MKSFRPGSILLVALTLTAGSALAAFAADEAAPAMPVPVGASWSFAGTASGHFVDKAYFGTGLEDRSYWGEGFQRLRINSGSPAGYWFSAGGVVAGTSGTDYYGTQDVGDGRLDQLVAGAVNLFGSGVDVSAGRQDIVMGDGFLVGDGYRDTRAALWNIPLNYYDGLVASWSKNGVHALAMGANLSRSFGGDGVYPKGLIVGGELGFAPVEGADLTGAYLQRIDDGGTNVDATAFSVRGSWTKGAFTLAGEGVLEGGTAGDVDLAGRGGHVRLSWEGGAKYKPAAKLQYFYFSGDDAGTDKDESFLPWQYRWNDWSQYYVGDVLASTVGTGSDMRVLLAQVGVTPREGTGVRLLVHDLRLDTGAAYALPDGASKAFANEFDLVLDQAFGDHWTAWLMGGYVVPGDAAKASWGSENTTQLFASVSWSFGNAGGGD